MTTKPITEMSEEELLEELRSLRSRRAISMENRRGSRKTTKVSPGGDFESLFGSDPFSAVEGTDLDVTVADTTESERLSDEQVSLETYDD